MSLRDVKGTNALTVLFSEPEQNNKTRMFFCPYRRNIVGAYIGKVVSIQPGYDLNDAPLFFVRPQRADRDANINYVFSSTDADEESESFWIQDQYFDTEDVRIYFCHNCQAPQLYFDENQAFDYKTKKELSTSDQYLCDNCELSFTFMGIVSIRETW